MATGKVLPALHGDINIEGIDLDGQSHTPVVWAVMIVVPEPTKGS